MGPRTSELLSNLPSRGYFATVEATTTRAPSYVCSHETRPPINQRLTGQDGPYLLRLLLQKKSKDAEARRKHQQQGQEKAAGKRPASGAPKEPAKRANTAGPSSSPAKWTLQQLRKKSNNELGHILRSAGGKPSNKKKEELIGDILKQQQQQEQ